MRPANRKKLIYKDGFDVTTPLTVNFVDRLRILFGGRFSLRLRVYCENFAGATKTESVFTVEKIFPQHIRESLVFSKQGE